MERMCGRTLQLHMHFNLFHLFRSMSRHVLSSDMSTCYMISSPLKGCGEHMADSGLLPQIVLGPVLAGLGDDHPRVRYAALACVGQMSQDFGDWDGGGGSDVDDGNEEEQDLTEEGSFQGTFHAQVGGVRK